MNRRYIIYSEPFSKYVFRAMRDATADQKKNLDPLDLKYFASETKMKELVHNEPMERLLLILAKLGKNWDLRVYDNEADADHIEELSINQFQFPELRVDVIEKQAATQTHYLSSREVVLAMAMCSRNVHTPVYSLSNGHQYLLKKVKGIRRVRLPYQEHINETAGAMEDLSKLQMAILNSFDWALKTLGLEQNDIRVLTALFNKRHGALTQHEIAQTTKLEGKLAYLKKNMERLEELGMIGSDKGIATPMNAGKGVIKNNRVYYIITGKGIGKVMEYLNYIHETTFGSRG